MQHTDGKQPEKTSVFGWILDYFIIAHNRSKCYFSKGKYLRTTWYNPDTSVYEKSFGACVYRLRLYTLDLFKHSRSFQLSRKSLFFWQCRMPVAPGLCWPGEDYGPHGRIATDMVRTCSKVIKFSLPSPSESRCFNLTMMVRLVQHDHHHNCHHQKKHHYSLYFL